jgi:hypothetical protein
MDSLCDFCGLPLEIHGWNWCIKDGQSRRYPFNGETWLERTPRMYEELRNLKISAGGVYHIRKLDNGKHGFIGGPEIVEIDEDIANRCQTTGSVYYIDGDHVAEFKDYLTGELYGQPLDDSGEAEGSAEAE